MRKNKLLYIFILSGCICVFILVLVFNKRQGEVKIGWKSDLQLLKQEMLQNEVSLKTNDKRSKAFVQDVDRILENIMKYKNDDEIKIEISKVIASLGEGHTSLQPWDEKIIPIKLYMQEDKLYVIDTINDYSEILYLELQEINNHPVKNVIKQLSNIVSKDNNQGLKLNIPVYIICPSILYGLGIIDNKEEIQLEFHGETKNVKIKVNPLEISKAKSNFLAPHSDTLLSYKFSKKNYGFEYLKFNQGIYIAYNFCEEDSNYVLSKFEDDIIATLHQFQVKKIIIDLRRNPGGDSTLLEPLILRLKNQATLKDRVTVLIGRGTASSAIQNAIQIQELLGAKLIGEATGGDPNKPGEVRTLTLPNSGLHLNYSTQEFHLQNKNVDALYPDILVDYLVLDYKDGIDPVLSAAIDYD